MALVGQVGVKFTGDTAEYTAATARVKKENAAVAQSGRDMFKSLGSQFGKGSLLGDVGKALSGRGAFGGITMLLNETDNALKKAVELQTQYKLGAISAGEMADELAKSIPILGHIYSAGRSIHELISGEEAETAAIEASTKALEKKIQFQKDYAEGMKNLTRQNEDIKDFLDNKPGLTMKDVAAGKPGFQTDVNELRKWRERSVEDAPGIAAKREAALMKEITDEKTALGEHLKILKESAGASERFTPSGSGGAGKLIPADPKVLASIAETEQSLKKAENKASDLRANSSKNQQLVIDQIEAEARSKALHLGAGLVSDFIGPYADTALAAAKRVVEESRGISDVNRQVIESSRTEIQQYQDAINTLSFDQAKMSAKDYAQASSQIFRDTILKGVTDQLHLREEAKSAAKQAADVQLGAEDQLKQMMQDRLHAGAALGNSEAARAAARLQIESEIEQKRRQLIDIINNDKVNKNLRDSASDELGKLPALKDAMTSALNQSLNSPLIKATPQLSAHFSTNGPDASIPKGLLDQSTKQTSMLGQIFTAISKGWGTVVSIGN